MKETRYKDTDLREALRRKYADTPQLPADFMANMEQQMVKDAPTVRRWRWVAAAASLLLLIGIGATLMNRPETQVTPDVVAKVEPRPQLNVVSRAEQKEEKAQPVRPTVEPRRQARKRQTVVAEPKSKEAYETDDANIHYVAYNLTKDSVPYQDPARVDEFIEKFAGYYNVKEGELTCSATKDSSVVSAVYVFPDTKEIDVFSRLLQAACWYSDETPGYLLNFSHQQFFFELKDMRKRLQYRWIAERVNGKILLYSTCAPLGTKESSACYQEYRDELMHIKSINHKTKQI